MKISLRFKNQLSYNETLISFLSFAKRKQTARTCVLLSRTFVAIHANVLIKSRVYTREPLRTTCELLRTTYELLRTTYELLRTTYRIATYYVWIATYYVWIATYIRVNCYVLRMICYVYTRDFIQRV